MSEALPPVIGQGVDLAATDDDRPMRAREVLRSLRRDPAALVSLVVLLLIALIAVLAPLITPHDPLQTYNDIGLGPQGQPLPPGTPGFLLGTDALGRDVLSRLISGTQVSLVIGIVANGLATIVGVTVGVIAGYFGGIVEAVLMRITDVVISSRSCSSAPRSSRSPPGAPRTSSSSSPSSTGRRSPASSAAWSSR